MEVTKLKLYEKREDLKKIFSEYSVNIKNVSIYGIVLDNTIGTSAELNILINQEISEEFQRRLESRVSALLNATCEIQKKDNEGHFKSSADVDGFLSNEIVIQAISNTAKPIEEIFIEGEKEFFLVKATKDHITRSELSSGDLEELQDPGQLSLQKKEALIWIGKNYFPLTKKSSRLRASLYSYFSEEEQKIIDYAKKWNPFVASANNEIDVMKILLEAKLDLKQEDEFGDTLLNKAVFLRHKNMVDLLLKHGANPAFCGSNKKTAFDIEKMVPFNPIKKALLSSVPELSSTNFSSPLSSSLSLRRPSSVQGKDEKALTLVTQIRDLLDEVYSAETPYYVEINAKLVAYKKRAGTALLTIEERTALESMLQTLQGGTKQLSGTLT